MRGAYRRLTGLAGAAVLAVLVSCAQEMVEPEAGGEEPDGQEEPMDGESSKRTLGLVEVTLQGVGTAEMQASVVSSARSRSLNAAAGSPSEPGNSDGSGDGTIQFDALSTGSFTTGTRGVDGVRYISATYRIRNAQADGTPYDEPRTDLMFMAVSTSSSLNGTPVSQFSRFDGSPASESIASDMVPTGHAKLDQGTGEVTSDQPDVLQILTEAEVAGIDAPAAVTSVFPYGFVVRCVNNCTTGRTLAANPGPDQYDGLVTFAFKVPLQADADDDPFTISMFFLAVDDDVTRVTQSVEEQDATAAAAFESYASTLGASSVTLLPGGPFPGSLTHRTICSVRTAGTSGTPTGNMFETAGPADSVGVAVDDGELTANGLTQTTATVTVFDSDGAPRICGGDDVSLSVGGINENTPGATLSAVTDHNDGTYTATLTAPVNNGSETLSAELGGTEKDTESLTYTGGNNVPSADPGPTVTFQEDLEGSNGQITLTGSDADGDPLTIVVENIGISEVGLPGSFFSDEEGGEEIDAGDTTADLDLFFTPRANTFGNSFANVSYHLTDGTGQSAAPNTTISVNISSVNDLPAPTLPSELEGNPNQDILFEMGGTDPEGDTWTVEFFTLPSFRGTLYHIESGSSEQEIDSQSNAKLPGTSQTTTWPMKFVPLADDCEDDGAYNGFTYRFFEDDAFPSDEFEVEIFIPCT